MRPSLLAMCVWLVGCGTAVPQAVNEPEPAAATAAPAAREARARCAPYRAAAPTCPRIVASEEIPRIAPPWGPLVPGPITRCAQGSSDHTAATIALDDLRSAFEALEPGDDVAALRIQLTELLRLPCFEPARENRDLPALVNADRAEWWFEAGGRGWLESYLATPRREGEELAWPVVFPPHERIGFTAGGPGGLHCGPNDSNCAVETGGWMRRAQSNLRSSRGGISPTYDAEPCERLARAAAPGHRYIVWYDCLASRRYHQPALPSTRTRAPRDGWLLLTHRDRGGYFQAKAYDLATGATHLVRNRSSSSEDLPDEHSMGRVDVSNLREALWMLLVAPRVDPVGRSVDYVHAPSDLPPTWEAPRPGLLTGRPAPVRISGDGPVYWRWVDPDGCDRASGTFRAIIEPRPAYQLASDLLRITAAGFIEECVAGGARPPFEGLAQSEEPGFHETHAPIVEALCQGTAPSCPSMR